MGSIGQVQILRGAALDDNRQTDANCEPHRQGDKKEQDMDPPATSGRT
jgi:hypothetical protein